MGCFNKTGFLSHLPIQYGDEIVMFVCADESKAHHRSSCPIGLVGGGLTPIAPPFFGKYDDYGGIEDVVDDPNHKYFTEVVGMTIKEFSDVIHDLSGYTIKDFRDGIKKYEEDPDRENNYHHETKEDFQKMLDLYTKIFKCSEFPIPPQRDNEDDETYKKIRKIYEEMQEYENRLLDNTSIVIIIEHKSVYDKMVEVGRETYPEGWYRNEYKTPEEAFDISLRYYRLIKDTGANEIEGLEDFNPLTIGVHPVYMEDKIYESLFGIKALLHDTVTIGDNDYAIYRKFNRDFSEFKEVFVNYAYFLSSMHKMSVMFETSPYHNQTVCYNTLIPVFEEILNTLKKSATERGYED